jgi:mitofilin
MEDLRCEMDRQLRVQLKRQSAAHSEHLQDALMEQQKMFERRWDSAFEDGLSSSKRTYLTKMAEAQSRLAGIKEALLSKFPDCLSSHFVQRLQMWIDINFSLSHVREHQLQNENR